MICKWYFLCLGNAFRLQRLNMLMEIYSKLFYFILQRCCKDKKEIRSEMR